MVEEKGKTVGKPAHSFDYSGQTIIPIKDRNSKRQQVIAQAKHPDDEGRSRRLDGGVVC
jgi:hypothetical protein